MSVDIKKIQNNGIEETVKIKKIADKNTQKAIDLIVKEVQLGD